MPWTDTQLAAAFNALSPVPATLDAAAKLLNAQTTSVTVDVPVGTLYGALLLNGGWIGMQAWVKANAADTTTLPVVLSLQAMLTSPNIATVQMSNPTTATTVEGMLAQLVKGGALTSAQQTEVLALASAVVPMWQPAVEPLDIYNALGRPANISQLTWVVS